MEYSNEIISLSLVGITRPGSKGLISALNIKAPHSLDATNVMSCFYYAKPFPYFFWLASKLTG